MKKLFCVIVRGKENKLPVHHPLCFVMGAAAVTYYPRWTAGLWRDDRHERGQKGQHTGVVMAVVKRTQGGWQMTAIGSTTMGRTVRDLVTDAQQAIPS